MNEEVRSYVRPHDRQNPERAFFAFDCRGRGDKTKVVACGFGATPGEALNAVQPHKAKRAKA